MSTTVETGYEIDAPYNLTLRQLAAKSHSVLVGTALDFFSLNSVGNPPAALLYGTIAATEYNLIMDTNACTMYSIASGFDPSKWDYTRCESMIKFAKDND